MHAAAWTSPIRNSSVCRAHVFPKITPSPSGIVTPSNTLFHGLKPTRHPIRQVDQFSRFCTGPKCYAVQCIVNGEENPQNCSFFLEFRHPATAIGNMHNKLAKIARVLLEISSRTDGQTHRLKTHRHAHCNTSQPLPRQSIFYFCIDRSKYLQTNIFNDSFSSAREIKNTT